MQRSIQTDGKEWRSTAARALGGLVVMLGVLTIRCESPIREALGGSRLSRIVLHPLRSLTFRAFPQTFAAGLGIIMVGYLLLLVSSRPGHAEEASPTWESLDTRDRLLVWLGPLLVLGLFAVLQWRHALHSFPIVVLYLALLGTSIWLFSRSDRRKGLRLGVRLTTGEILALVLATVALLLLYRREMNSWKFSFIGDEWAFFERARQMVVSPNQWLNVGTIEDIPLTLSTFQSLFLRVLGRHNVPWRLSMAVLMVSALPPLYLTLRHIVPVPSMPRWGAALGCGWFFLSEPILDWAALGKPCGEFAPPLIFTVCLFLASRSRESRALLFLTGVTSGLACFLSSLSAVLCVFVIGGWIALEGLLGHGRGDLRRRLIVPSAVFLAGFVVAAAPVLVQWQFWERQVGRTVVSEEALMNRPLMIPKTVQASLAFLEYHGNGQFLYKNMVDPITAVLATVGIVVGRGLGRRHWLFLLWCLLAVAFVTGGISQYGYPPPTRTWVVLYPIAILAAAGFGGLIGRSKGPAIAVGFLLLFASASYNVLKLDTWNPYQVAHDYRMVELQRIQESSPNTLHVLVFHPGSQGLLEEVLTAYRLRHRAVLFEDTPTGLRQLETLLRRDRGHVPIEVRAEGTASAERLRLLTLSMGARFGPRIGPTVSENHEPLRVSLSRLFDWTNP